MTTTTNPWCIGDHVHGGETHEDYDHGIVIDVDGPRVLVAWRWSQVTTWDSAEGLGLWRPEAEARMAARLAEAEARRAARL